LKGERSLSVGTPPRRSILFLDATDAQAAGAEALAREHFGSLLGEVLRVVRGPIRMEYTDQEVAVKAADLLEVRMRRAVIPADQQGRIVWHEPLIPLEETVLAHSLEDMYHGAEFGRWLRRENGTTGYYGRFRLPAR
jgi:hypothetical protein